MKPKTHTYILLAIFLVSALLRIMLAYQAENYDYEAYFTLRQAEHIKQTGIPLYTDDMSSQGRSFLFAPLFYYVTAFFMFFFSPEIVIKVILNILAASTVMMVFLLSDTLIKKKDISLLIAFFAGLTPGFFSSTLNNASIYTLVAPLFLLIVYLLLNISKPRYTIYLILCLSALVLTSPLVYVLILGMIFYIILQKTEGFSIKPIDLELLLFITFSSLWFNMLIFKKAFLFHGFQVIWGNIPNQLLANYFTDIGFVQLIYLIGFVPLVLGMFTVYHVLFRQKNKAHLLVIGVGIAFFLLLLFKMIALIEGVIMFSLILVLLSGQSISQIVSYFKKTKAWWISIPIIVLIVVLFIFTSVIQAFYLGMDNLQTSPSKADISAMEWLKQNSGQHEIVLATVKEGYLLNYYGRKNAIDQQYLLVSDINPRYQELTGVWSQQLETGAIRTLDKYGIRYILLSEHYFKEYSERPQFILNKECFNLVFNRTAEIYKKQCELTTI